MPGCYRLYGYMNGSGFLLSALAFAPVATGGRPALAEVQRFPADYDGVVAWAPAKYMTRLQGSQVWTPETDIASSEKAISSGMNSVDPNLKLFLSYGVSFIQYHGWPDSGVPPAKNVAYYKTVLEALGSAAKMNDSCCLFIIPDVGTLPLCPCPQTPAHNGSGARTPPPTLFVSKIHILILVSRMGQDA